MTILDEPLFLSNPEWYYYDTIEHKYKLTNKATEAAKKSYEEFYSLLNNKEVNYGKN